MEPGDEFLNSNSPLTPAKKQNKHSSRIKKSPSQLRILKAELKKSNYWTKERCARLSDKTGLSASQFYKWAWDQNQKIFSKFYSLRSTEALRPTPLDTDLNRVQQLYKIALSLRKQYLTKIK